MLELRTLIEEADVALGSQKLSIALTSDCRSTCRFSGRPMPALGLRHHSTAVLERPLRSGCGRSLGSVNRLLSAEKRFFECRTEVVARTSRAHSLSRIESSCGFTKRPLRSGKQAPGEIVGARPIQGAGSVKAATQQVDQPANSLAEVHQEEVLLR